MDLIDDERAGRLQHATPAVAGQQDVQRFGSSYNNMRRAFGHRSALAGRCVTCSNKCPDINLRQTQRSQFFLNAGQRHLQIALDIIAESLERRDINDVSDVVEFSFHAQSHQVIDGS